MASDRRVPAPILHFIREASINYVDKEGGNIHSSLDCKWFHETLYIFVSYMKEFPDFMTVNLSIFLANSKIFSRFQNK